MNNTEPTNSYANGLWRFIEDYLPNYYSRDDVLRDDILYRYYDGDDISDEDMYWIKAEYNGDKRLVKDELARLENGFIEESLHAFYTQITAT